MQREVWSMRQKHTGAVGVLAAGLLIVATAQGLAEDKYLIDIIAGTVGSGCSGDGGPARDAMFSVDDGGSLALETSGRIYLTDSNSHRVRRIDTSGIITTVAGNGTGATPDGGPVTAAQLLFPYSIAVDATGTLFIGELGNDRFRKVDASGIISSFEVAELPGAGEHHGHNPMAFLYRANGVKVDKEGNLYCATSSMIAKISLSSGLDNLLRAVGSVRSRPVVLDMHVLPGTRPRPLCLRQGIEPAVPAGSVRESVPTWRAPGVSAIPVTAVRAESIVSASHGTCGRRGG